MNMFTRWFKTVSVSKFDNSADLADKYRALTTSDFRHNMSESSYQGMFIKRFIVTYPDIAQMFIDNEIQFSWNDTDQGKLECSHFEYEDTYRSMRGDATIHLYQPPITVPELFNTALRILAKILEVYWVTDICFNWAQSGIISCEELGSIQHEVDTCAHVRKVLCYDGLYGSVSLFSTYSKQSTKYKFVIYEGDLYLDTDAKLEISLEQAISDFKELAYDAEGGLVIEHVNNYDSFINEPSYPVTEMREDSYVFYVGGRMSGVQIF